MYNAAMKITIVTPLIKQSMDFFRDCSLTSYVIAKEI